MQTVATIRHGTWDCILHQNTDKAREEEIPQLPQKNFRRENFVNSMAKFGAGKIWHKFSNTMAKFGTILLCQISPLQIPPIPKFSPPVVRWWMHDPTSLFLKKGLWTPHKGTGRCRSGSAPADRYLPPRCSELPKLPNSRAHSRAGPVITARLLVSLAPCRLPRALVTEYPSPQSNNAWNACC